MMMKYATVTVTEGGKGTWEGPPLAEVSRDLLRNLDIYSPQVGDVFWIGPFPVRVVDLRPYERAFDVIIVERRDGKNIPDEVFLFWYKITLFMRLVNIRLLKTAKIWNLLDVEEGVRPYWGDLRVLKAFRRKKNDQA